jgi:hypothetical protein
MDKTPSNLDLFYNTIDQATKYLIVLDPDLMSYDEFKEEYIDTGEKDWEAAWNKYQYYEMVMSCLQNERFKQDLLDSYRMKYIGVVDGYDGNGEFYENAIIQINDRFFCAAYYRRHWFDGLEEVKPETRIVYIPIDKEVPI